MNEVQCLWQGKNQVGEGPVWHPAQQTIYWVDIIEPSLQSLHLASKIYKKWPMPSMIGAFTFCQDGRILAALRTGFAYIDLLTDQIDIQTAILPADSNLRFNDGKCDRAGRFFAGTMDMTEQSHAGVLYCYDGRSAIQVADDYVIANGLGWSLDNKRFYHADSSLGKIFVYDYDFNTGGLSNRHLFVDVPEDQGYCDGLCVDSDGYIWSAHWQGWRITRYAPDATIDRVIDMPITSPTSCCFGGPDMTTLFVTSASVDLSPEQQTTGPLAGSLFAIETGIKGIAESLFLN